MNTPKLMTYEQAKAGLLAELDVWDKYDSEREPIPEELSEMLEDEGLCPSGSIKRARCLIPLILNRLEEDTKHKPYPADLAVQMLDGATKTLSTMRRWFNDEWRSQIDPDTYPSEPEKLVINASNSIRNALSKWTASDVRFRSDMKRLYLDLWIIGTWLLDFADNARRHGEWPPEETGQWDKDQWCAYFWRNLCRRSPLISYVEKHGLSQTSLDKGFIREEIFSRRSEQRARDFVKRYELERKLASAWDREHPELYLNMKELPAPPPEDNDDLRLEVIDIAEEAFAQKESWRRSIPEINRWSDDRAERPRRPYEKDRAFKELHKFSLKFFKASKQNWEHHQMETETPQEYRPALDQYLALLILCAQGVMIHGLLDEEWDKPDANRLKGCHRFCAGVFDRFAQAVKVCNNLSYRDLAAEAHQLAGKIII